MATRPAGPALTPIAAAALVPERLEAVVAPEDDDAHAESGPPASPHQTFSRRVPG